MSTDTTEAIRREMLPEVNAVTRDELGNERPKDQVRLDLEAQYGQVWSTEELSNDFTVLGFSTPLVVVIRKSDNVKGSLKFCHQPRYYFEFEPYNG